MDDALLDEMIAYHESQTKFWAGGTEAYSDHLRWLKACREERAKASAVCETCDGSKKVPCPKGDMEGTPQVCMDAAAPCPPGFLAGPCEKPCPKCQTPDRGVQS